MIKKLFTPFVALGTLLKNKVHTDPFFLARIQIIALYLLVGIIIFLVFGWTFGYLVRQPFYQIAIYQNGDAVRHAINVLEKQLLLQRVEMIGLFAIATYFLTEFVLRPIKKSAELQKRFIAVVSHELRTPLTIMKNASEIALRNPDTLTHEKAVTLIKSNLEETNRLSQTIQFLLTLSTLQNRGNVSEMKHISLTTVVERVLGLMKSEAADCGVVLTVEMPENMQVMVRGNSVALEGLLVNLVKNAIAHTPAGGRISILTEKETVVVRLSVRDTGKGIAKKDAPYIFKPFYRGESPYADRSSLQGAGLGLSIVKEVVDFHKASISVSTIPGNGTTFTITFPA
jgi:signal transduction histidine kinase